MAYGADPTGATSSQAAIEDAVAVAGEIVGGSDSIGGQIVYLPFGLYQTNETIVCPNRVRIAGVSARGTQVKAAAGFTGDHMFEFVNGTSAMFDTGISRMRLNANSVSSLSCILHNAPHENTEFDNILLSNFDLYGLEVANAYEGASHFLMNNCEMAPDNGAAAGIYLDCGGFSTTCVINGLTINGDVQAEKGIHLVSQYVNLIATMYHTENVDDAVYVTGANCSTTLIGARGQSTVTNLVRHLDGGNNRRLHMINCSKHGGTNFFSDGSYVETEDIADFKVPHLQTFSNDATPSVGNRAGTIRLSGTTTITGFDDAVNNQEWFVRFNGAMDVDLSANSALVGNGGVDFTAAVGDGMLCRHDNGVTYCFIADKA